MLGLGQFFTVGSNTTVSIFLQLMVFYLWPKGMQFSKLLEPGAECLSQFTFLSGSAHLPDYFEKRWMCTSVPRGC